MLGSACGVRARRVHPPAMPPFDEDDPEGQAKDEQNPHPAPVGLVPAIESSLVAKRERLLRRPLIAKVVLPSGLSPGHGEDEDETDDADEGADELDFFAAVQADTRARAPRSFGSRRPSPWREDSRDGTWRVSIAIDYADLWRGSEKEVLEVVQGTIENHVAFLTDEQHQLLLRSPREYLDLFPPPESAELIGYRIEPSGGVENVVELTVEAPPDAVHLVHHIAIIPNLIPLERQLAGVRTVAAATDEGPLAPLRALLGLNDGASLVDAPSPQSEPTSFSGLDSSQAECVRKALDTPHFCVIQGPPGSGKTTVISTIIRHALERGERVLVVSPTHVAVDNVVEKLAPKLDHEGPDDLEKRSLPVRYAAKPGKLSKAAFAYWIGPRKQRRGAKLAQRVEAQLRAKLPFADELFDRLDDNAPGHAPITEAVASAQGVICGTPIGILSYAPVKEAGPAAFDVLVVDEVSKMTLPEFIAIAIKTKRWILVGDPEQLPPYNSAEENGEALDDVFAPGVELACSVASILERQRPERRKFERILVVASEAERAADLIAEHLDTIAIESGTVATFAEMDDDAIVVCEPADLGAAVQRLSPAHGRDRTHNPELAGSVSILVERGVTVPRPAFASGCRFVDPKLRAQPRIFETAFNVYHAQPWSVRTGQRLWLVESRRGMDKYLPSAPLLRMASALDDDAAAWTARQRAIDRVAERFAVNAVSVYDWLTGIPTGDFDTAPLQELGPLVAPLANLHAAVAPFVGTLRKQYRMRPSLSRVPREHFYFGEALHDGKGGVDDRSRVGLVQVLADGNGGEVNEKEAAEIRALLARSTAPRRARRRTRRS